MRDDWVLLMRLDDSADPFVLPNDPLLCNTFRLLSHITCFVHHSKHLGVSAFRHAFARFSNFRHANSHNRHRFFFTQLQHVPPHSHSLPALFCHALSTFSIKHLFTAQPLPILSLAAAIIPLPPLDNSTSHMLPTPSADKTPCDVLHHRSCLAHSFPDLDWIRRAVEPVTGIEFPGVLNNRLPNHNQSNLSPEVLVGTGSRTMTIIKIKSLKVYAFGFYVHPYSVCQKLGSKYASIPVPELKDRNDFYEDLLREDIGMTVRLVVNCNGMKITAVKDAFEKSLRARLLKTNPETDFKCIATFGSYFTKDIPLPVGTVIDFRRTADGQLITEIGGNQIGAVRSRELCRAFFDMYLGEVPVSKETKEVIGNNVASIVGRC